jgi:formylglycine-generating enzyme required for sulfatase activity/endonuclease/exonuclease/phosphatase family metal-dependent hydrolase
VAQGLRLALAVVAASSLASLGGAAEAPPGGDAVVNSLGLRMVLVPAGAFQQGSPAGEPMRQEEETPRRVTLTRAFRIAATEVTQRQWLALMPQNPSPKKGDDLPVTSVSWKDALAFCLALSQKEGVRYRLPTEAEWEYACRAGSAEGPAGRDELEAAAWFADNSEEAAHPVAQKRPNAWGLHDLLGNVAEWTQDVYGPYPRVAEDEDPTGPVAGSTRVVRGGSWRGFVPALRCAARAGTPESYQLPHVGLRVVTEPGPAAAAAAEAALRVMSFNIRYDNPDDGEDAWPKRRAMAASMIRFHRADVVGLQEALRGQIADLEAALPEFGWFGSGRSAERDGEHCAVLFRKDRVEVLDQGTFWLSETPEVAGSRSWDAALPRIVTWGRLRDRRNGAVFHLFNTHFDHRGETARRESARLLRRKVAEIAGQDGPVVVTGDFNSTPDSDPYRILTALGPPGEPPGLVDALLASRHPHHGPTSSWNGFQAIEAGRRIDLVLVRPPVVVRQHGILSDTFDGRFPSDHLPVVAEVTLGRPPGF